MFLGIRNAKTTVAFEMSCLKKLPYFTQHHFWRLPISGAGLVLPFLKLNNLHLVQAITHRNGESSNPRTLAPRLAASINILPSPAPRSMTVSSSFIPNCLKALRTTAMLVGA